MHAIVRAMRQPWAIVAAIACALVLSLIARVVSAAPFNPDSSDWEGCTRLVEVAREELGASRVDVVDEIDYESLAPGDGLLILHPEGSYDLDELATFMRLGGRLAIADDFGDGDHLLDRFRIARKPAPSDPLQMLHGNPQLPVAVPASGHPIVADVGQVVLNHPTTVDHPDLSPLLRIPLSGGDPGPFVALAGQVGEGRLVAIGDPSIFINSMMRFPGNRAFARNLVAYLLDGAGDRKHEAKLVVTHDKFKERGSRAGGLAGGLRDRLRGLFNAVDAVRREGFGGIASRVIALAIAIAAGVWVLVRAAFRSKIPRPRYAAANPEAEHVARGLDDPRIAPLLVPGGLLARRPRIAPAGVAVVHEALEGAIAARDDLSSLQRPDAVNKLAVEAGLTPDEAKQAERAFVRLRGEISNQAVGGGRVSALSKKDATLLGRVLAPLAGSLRGIPSAAKPDVDGPSRNAT
jgi:hypothetical protein